MNARKDYITEMDTREAILAIAKDLRAYAEFEHESDQATITEKYARLNRKESLLFAADYIEKSL